jgi:hypothetical protein
VIELHNVIIMVIYVRREVNMKPVKVENEEIRKVIFSGEDYIQIDDRKFLLFEVDQIKEPNVYEVTDLDEESQLRKALEEDNPILSEEEINKMLGI